MKRHILIITTLLSIFIFSCKEKSEEQKITIKVENVEPKVNFNSLQTDFKKWWAYHSYNISLSSNFIGLNEKAKKIDESIFLEKLTSGKFIPLKLKSLDGISQYKLYKLGSIANKNIVSTIKNEALTKLKYYKMVGMSFPKFDFTDLKGNHYTNESTNGKIIVIKTWFINCKACIAEFPELNELVKKYKDSKDVIFLSLALDSKPKLEKFLKKRMFEYKIVPNQKEFIDKKLNLQIYPTHIVLDKNGIILKVVNKASEMISFLKKNRKANKNIEPPPPM